MSKLADDFRKLLVEGLTQGEALNILADHGDKYPEAAADVKTSDELELDDNPMFSKGEGGTWVSAWVWVPDPEQEFDPTCALCEFGEEHEH